MNNLWNLVVDRVENLIVWGGNEAVVGNINKGLLLQDGTTTRRNFRALPDRNNLAATPNAGFNTPVYHVFRRPIDVETIGANNEIPAVYIYLTNGVPNLATNLSDNVLSKVIIGNDIEVIFFNIDVVLDADHGAADSSGNPHPLTDQVAGVRADLAVLLKPYTLIDIDFDVLGTGATNPAFIAQLPLISAVDGGVVNWDVGISDDIEKIPSKLEIVRVLIGVIIQYPKNLEKPIL